MEITNEQWKDVEKRILDFGRGVEFRAGDTVVRYVMRRKTPFKNVLMTFVDGQCRGEWSNASESCPQQTFLNRCERSIFSPKRKAAARKLGKHKLKTLGIDLDKKLTYFSPFWSSAKSLVRHLKTIEGLELVSIQGEMIK